MAGKAGEQRAVTGGGQLSPNGKTLTEQISPQTEFVTCERSVAGQAAAHIPPLPLLLVIQKLRLIPVV